MKRKKSQCFISAVLVLLSLAMVVTGIAGFAMRGNSYTAGKLEEMRVYAVLRTAAGVLINEYALNAKKIAREYADANAFSRNARAAYASEKEAAARAEAEQKYTQFGDFDITAVIADILVLERAQKAHAEREAAEKAAYSDQFAASSQTEEEIAEEIEKLAESDVTTEVSVSEEALLEETAGTETVDFSGFTASRELLTLKEAIRPEFDRLWEDLRIILPELTDKMKTGAGKSILEIVYAYGSSFDMQYDRYADAGGASILLAGDDLKMTVARSGDDMLTIGVGLTLLALTVFFYKQLVTALGVPRMVILLFFVLLCVLAGLYGISVSAMIGNVLRRTGMYGILALAMLPGIQCGISLNMGMTIGIISGLLSTLIALEMDMAGWGAFAFSVIGGILFSIPVGYLYSKLLNRLKGNEMTVSTYVGFSYVSLMCIAWMLLPFHNYKLTWALGSGLRVMHNMKDSFGAILNDLWSFKLFGATVPTGLLLFFLLCCLFMWLFSRSKTGTAMIAAGSNPRFAEAAGINVNKMRTIGTTISTVIASVGIIVYSQSFGFMQLYSGPRQMGFIAASAILIGGASVSRAKVSHVIIGTFLFQGVLALGIQVANAAIAEGGLSEVMRILISNGIILYALTQSGGESRA